MNWQREPRNYRINRDELNKQTNESNLSDKQEKNNLSEKQNDVTNELNNVDKEMDKLSEING